jgi:hypothetical protein
VILARILDKAWFPWGSQQCLDTLAKVAKLGKPSTEIVHPISVLFTPEQVRWLDARRSDGLSRSAVIRLVVAEAMRLHRDGILPATK